MSCIKSVDKVNQEKKLLRQKKHKNLKRDKFVELDDRGLSSVQRTTEDKKGLCAGEGAPQILKMLASMREKH